MEQIKLIDIMKEHEGKGFTVKALSQINLSINKGEMIAIMGTSGSGKTTLLNILGLIDTPTEGEYYLDGQNIADLTEKKLAKLRNEKIGFVLQDFGLIAQYTIERNVSLPLYYSGIPRKEWKQRTLELLAKVGISDKAKCIPAELSGGQKQRAAIARALIAQADIILADEPTGALDSKTSIEIMELFSQVKEQGKTVILVTHDAQIATYCDKIYYIEDGVLNSYD